MPWHCQGDNEDVDVSECVRVRKWIIYTAYRILVNQSDTIQSHGTFTIIVTMMLHFIH